MPLTASERHRRSLTAALRAKGALSDRRVEEAFEAVAREHFLPETIADGGLEAVYRDEAILTMRSAQGMPLSSSSQPAVMARMLELLDVQPGDRVLEIGAGTGYNAALLAHLAGPSGRVVSIDPELARKARRALRDAGAHARIVAGDGRDGYAAGAPFDPDHRDRLSWRVPRGLAGAAARGGTARVAAAPGPRAQRDPGHPCARAPRHVNAVGRPDLGRVHAAARGRLRIAGALVEPQRRPHQPRATLRPHLAQRRRDRPAFSEGSSATAYLAAEHAGPPAAARRHGPEQHAASRTVALPHLNLPAKRRVSLHQAPDGSASGSSTAQGKARRSCRCAAPGETQATSPRPRARWRLSPMPAMTRLPSSTSSSPNGNSSNAPARPRSTSPPAAAANDCISASPGGQQS